MASLEAMTATGWTLAIGLVVAGLLLERAARRRRSLWWASPPVYPMILLVFTAAGHPLIGLAVATARSEEHTSELQSLMRISYAVFCLKKKNNERTPTIQLS